MDVSPLGSGSAGMDEEHDPGDKRVARVAGPPLVLTFAGRATANLR